MSLPETPKVAVDGVVRYRDKIVIVDRKFPPLGLALVGGFMDVGETAKEAVAREVLEETGLRGYVTKLIGVYTDPRRDPRGHIISIAYIVEANDEDEIVRQNTEVKAIKLFEEGELLGEDGYKLIADHRQIFLDHLDVWR